MRHQHKIHTPLQREKLKPRTAIYWNTVSPSHAIGVRRYQLGWAWCARNGSVHTFADSGHWSYDEALQAAVSFWDDQRATAASYTLQDAVDGYCRHLANTKANRRAEVAARRTLEGKLTPALLKSQLADIELHQLELWRDSLVKGTDAESIRKSRASCNRVLASFRAACNRAHRSGHVDSDQGWRFLESYKGVDKARDRLLTDTEVQSLLYYSDGSIHHFLRFLVDTGCRVGEARDLDRSSVNWTTGEVVISGKTGSRVCILSSNTMNWLRDLPVSRDGSLLANEDGFRYKAGAHSRPIKKASSAAGVKDVIAYNLRHWFVSKAIAAGIPAMVVARRVGNSALQIEKSYFHAKLEDERDVFDAITI